MQVISVIKRLDGCEKTKSAYSHHLSDKATMRLFPLDARTHFQLQTRRVWCWLGRGDGRFGKGGGLLSWRTFSHRLGCTVSRVSWLAGSVVVRWQGPMMCRCIDVANNKGDKGREGGTEVVEENVRSRMSCSKCARGGTGQP